MEYLKCSRCHKQLTVEMEIEYSATNNEYYCGTDCAEDAYYNYMRSEPVIFGDEDQITVDDDILECDIYGKVYRAA